MNSDPRPFAGLRLGISISESDEGAPFGLGVGYVNRVTVTFASTFLSEGASVALGHNWKSGGVMEHVAQWAREFQWRQWDSADESERREPLVLNLLAWPDQPPSFDEEQRAELEGIVEVRQVPPPDGLPTDLDLPGFPRLVRVRANTAMRQALNRCCDARVSIGGKLKGFSGRLPGVLEEALLAWRTRRPLFISGALGGASALLADTLLQRQLAPEREHAFYSPDEVVALFGQYAQSFPVPREETVSTRHGEWNAYQEFAAIPLAELSRCAGLTEGEYVDLLKTHDTHRVMGWVIAGCARKLRDKTIGIQTESVSHP